MRNALQKEFHREIRASLQRFISILLISALGVAMFAGLRACKTDMLLSADSFYDKTNMMDSRVVSVYGLSRTDVEEVAEMEGVAAVEGIFSADVLLFRNGADVAVRLYSDTKTVNTQMVLSGRMPQKENECAVDQRFMENCGFQIGDTITLYSGTKDDLADILTVDTVTIVGEVATGRYMSSGRGSGTIGNGKIAGYLVLVPDSFAMDYYSELGVIFEGTRELNSYSEEYDDLIDAQKDKLEEVGEHRARARFDEIREDAYKELDKAYKEVQENEQALNDGEKEILNGEKRLADGFAALSLGREQLEQQIAALPPGVAENSEQIRKAQKELDGTEQELKKSEREFLEAKEEFYADFAENKQKIVDAYREIEKSRAEIDAMEFTKWYVLDRNTIESYVSFEQDADRMDAISKVFPAIFFLVAALVSLTTMTRMVDEGRTQIGTLKALGYSRTAVAKKYIKYALYATLFGSIIGVFCGGKIFPYIVITTYKLMYPCLPEVVMPIHRYYSVMAILIAVCCTLAATLTVCTRSFKEQPAALMRPVAPKEGKRILLERVGFVWKHLSFTRKASLRNIFRYKKRFFMTVIGIACCMALLLVGFGLKDSIGVMAHIQYGELWRYDGSVSISATAEEEEKNTLFSELARNKEIADASPVYETMIDLSSGDITKSISLIVLPDADAFARFFCFRDRNSGTEYTIEKGSILMTEKLARMLKVEAGDTVQFMPDAASFYPAEIAAITENYIYHYVFMTQTTYQQIFGEKPEYNECFLRFRESGKEAEEAIAADLLKQHEIVTSILVTSTLQKQIDDMLQSLNIIVYVLIICAGMLAFIVLYNLSNINITERRRELATLKVLGFYDGEVSGYVYRENVMMTLLGIFIGMAGGKVLHGYVITTCEVDIVMFGHIIKPASFLYSGLLTVLFAVLIGMIMHFKLKKINMVESLKSIE